jgi:FMN hydrolase / 5-amino-6-(5-phospho-D-ribitylamino)uracil phosphatase
MMDRHAKGCILFDWGDTLMRVFPVFTGPMKDWPRVEAVTGAAEMLSALHTDWTLAIATNAADSTEEDIRLALRRVDLDRWLDRVYCFKKIGFKKPSPEFYGYILKDMGLSAERVVMVGDDHENDVLGAVRCGLRAMWFNERDGKEDNEGMIRTIHQLSELTHILA